MASYNTGVTEVPLWIDSKQVNGTVVEGAVLGLRWRLVHVEAVAHGLSPVWIRRSRLG